MVITFLVFVIAGIWHGPTWGYIIFGSLHGLGLVINHTHRNFFKINLNKYISWLITFNFVNFANVFFRSQNLEMAFNVLKSMIGLNGYDFTFLSNQSVITVLVIITSFSVCLLFKNTNFLIEKFKPDTKSKID